MSTISVSGRRCFAGCSPVESRKVERSGLDRLDDWHDPFDELVIQQRLNIISRERVAFKRTDNLPTRIGTISNTPRETSPGRA